MMMPTANYSQAYSSFLLQLLRWKILCTKDFKEKSGYKGGDRSFLRVLEKLRNDGSIEYVKIPLFRGRFHKLTRKGYEVFGLDIDKEDKKFNYDLVITSRIGSRISEFNYVTDIRFPGEVNSKELVKLYQDQKFDYLLDLNQNGTKSTLVCHTVVGYIQNKKVIPQINYYLENESTDLRPCFIFCKEDDFNKTVKVIRNSEIERLNEFLFIYAPCGTWDHDVKRATAYYQGELVPLKSILEGEQKLS